MSTVQLFEDLLAFDAAITSAMLAVFTLLYSFASSAKRELMCVAQEMKCSSNDPIRHRREKYIKEQIRVITKTNSIVILILILSFSMGILEWVSLRFLGFKFQLVALWISLIINAFLLLLVIFESICIFKRYKKDCKITI